MSSCIHLPVFVALSSVLVSTVSLSVRAQDERASRKPSRDQTYVFPDDPLDAVGPSERGVRLRLRTKAGHATLIRPRTHFIVELTQSVENL